MLAGGLKRCLYGISSAQGHILCSIQSCSHVFGNALVAYELVSVIFIGCGGEVRDTLSRVGRYNRLSASRLSTQQPVAFPSIYVAVNHDSVQHRPLSASFLAEISVRSP